MKTVDTHWGGFGAGDSGFWSVRHGMESGEFAGDWYCAETGELFRFQDGLVSCEQHNLLTGTIDAMCGAYCF